ncbi:hypothetical protein SISSUDRAFT_1068085 [Sistotremastrum suecicum HHB10207 ss-3]|uniref:Uncharacterized protein n=1 Tax=Sistotremastrum suecicum HHB10207 ss-3 TaxID=1314776 RepID=A0A165WG18_9AGAM|nr:hypothetical protein SISSUDRAFT_1068085 [Sistotremastrum suecicum HHB10207 ss-3]
MSTVPNAASPHPQVHPTRLPASGISKEATLKGEEGKESSRVISDDMPLRVELARRPTFHVASRHSPIASALVGSCPSLSPSPSLSLRHSSLHQVTDDRKPPPPYPSKKRRISKILNRSRVFFCELSPTIIIFRFSIFVSHVLSIPSFIRDGSIPVIVWLSLTPALRIKRIKNCPNRWRSMPRIRSSTPSPINLEGSARWRWMQEK